MTIFPLFCTTSPRGTNGPFTGKPVSSRNSRFAASRGTSGSRYSPLGTDHDSASFFAHKGPPGCTRKTSSAVAPRRNISNPALRFGIIPVYQFFGGIVKHVDGTTSAWVAKLRRLGVIARSLPTKERIVGAGRRWPAGKVFCQNWPADEPG